LQQPIILFRLILNIGTAKIAHDEVLKQTINHDMLPVLKGYVARLMREKCRIIPEKYRRLFKAPLEKRPGMNLFRDVTIVY
jgi:hypothetical protein